MSIDSAAVANISMTDILINDVQLYLKNNAVLINTVKDYTSKVMMGDVSVDIPKLSAGATGDWLENGSEVASGGMGISVDTLDLDQFKHVSEYIYDVARAKTRADLNGYFLEVSPSQLGDLMEQALYAQLKLASAAAPDHILQLSGAGNILPTVGDVFKAAELMDLAKLPATGRFLAMNASAKYALMQEQAVIDASRSMTDSALVKGTFSEIAGIKLVFSNNCTADEMIGYHETAVGYAWGKSVAFEEERHASKMRDFLTLKTHYGMKVLDAGKRTVLFNATGA